MRRAGSTFRRNRGGPARSSRARAAAPAPSRAPHAQAIAPGPAGEIRFRWICLALYAATIVLAATHHEMWRDEVRALSLALNGRTVISMLAGLRDEGHPFLWYLLLRAGHLIIRSPLVLPITSASVATVAAWVFLWRSPFSRTWRVMFLFGVLPLFEYSVMCRNYGLGMLLLFAISAAYETRFTRPVMHGLLLLLLANTSAHAAILAGALTAAWVSEAWIIRPSPCAAAQRPGVAVGVVIALIGIGLCAYVTFPSAGSSVTGLRHSSVGGLASAAVTSLGKPGSLLRDIIVGGLPVNLIGLTGSFGRLITETLSGLLLLIVAFRLRRHLDLLSAFVLAVLVLGCFFQAVYAGFLRHRGLLFVMIVCLEWVARRREGVQDSPDGGRRVLAAALTVVLSTNMLQGLRVVWEDYEHRFSSSKAFATMIRSSADYRDAILIGEPDYLMESLPYYVDNRLYSVEQGEFIRWTRFSKSTRDTLSLGRLLDAAEEVGRSNGAPVLLAIGHRQVFSDSAGSIPYRYGWRFSWTEAERQRLLSEARPIVGFTSFIGDEDYFVFLLRRPAANPAVPRRVQHASG